MRLGSEGKLSFAMVGIPKVFSRTGSSNDYLGKDERFIKPVIET